MAATLPIELVVEISKFVSSTSDLNRLARACCLFYDHINPILYKKSQTDPGGGRSVLLWAVHENSPATVEVAARAGFGAECFRPPVLHKAAQLGRARMIESLLASYDFDVSELNETGYPALVYAALQGNDAETVQLLLRAGANPNQTCSRGQSPLIAAAKSNAVDIALILLQNGADISQLFSGENDRTALQVAAVHDNPDMIRFLLGHGADPAIVDSSNLTAFQLAIHIHGNVETVELLAKQGIGSAAGPGSATGLGLLQNAVSEGKADLVQLLFDYGISPKLGNPGTPEVPILAAACRGHTSVVDVLIKNGANMSMRGWKGTTALHDALMENKVEVVKLLVNSGADLTVVDDEGRQPVHVAYDTGREVLIEALLKSKADVTAEGPDGWNALAHTVKEGQHRVMKRLLKSGGNARQMSPHGPLLCVAASKNDCEAATILLSYSADPSDVDEDGRSALHNAAAVGHLEVTKLLLQHGADVSAGDNEGYTALHLAADAGSKEVIDVLLENGADLDCIAWDDTPLSITAGNGNLELTQHLLDKGADMDGNPCLWHAAGNGTLDILEALLSHGADGAKLDQEGDGAIHHAAMNGQVDILERLLRWGVDINETDQNMRTPLHLACMNGHPEAIIALLSQKPAPGTGIKDKDGATPLMLAQENGHGDVVSLLTK